MKALLLAIALLLVAGGSLADSVETTAANAVISPYTYWPTSPRAGRFYRPTGVRVGNEYFLYVQGGEYAKAPGTPVDPSIPGADVCREIGEKVLVFKTPWTSTGLRSQFQWVKTVSPCGTTAGATDIHYQSGSAFVSSTDSKVKLLVDETEGGSHPQSGHFKRVLLGSSTDGKNFAWSTFLRQSVIGGRTYSFDDVILVQATANTNWWGVYRWAWCDLCNGSDGIGFWHQGRIKVVMDATNPRGFVVYLTNSSGAWQAVGNDGTVNFVPGVTGMPYGVKSIINNNSTWEAWREEAATFNNGGCDDGDANSNSTFAYQTVNQAGGAGPHQVVTSTGRAMPSKNAYGRMMPFRMQDMNGKRLLYSASTDRVCQDGLLAGFRGFEIVVSEVNN